MTTTAHDILTAIDRAAAEEQEPEPRRYIGASIVGNPCDAVLALNLRGFPNTPPFPRLKRIFHLGKVMEAEIIKDLQAAGYEVSAEGDDGDEQGQHTYKMAGGHVVCHTDGLVKLDGEWAILEIKTMNTTSFAKFQKEGVKFSHPTYWGQLHMMMGLSGIGRALFVALNKNNSDYWAQIVEADPLEWANIQARIDTAVEAPRRIAGNRSDWRCEGCFKRESCWGLNEVTPTCPRCAHSAPTAEGGWHCMAHDKPAETPCERFERFQPGERQ